MKLAHYPHGKLSVSKTNMRYGRKRPDVSDILSTVREKGVIVPLIVRPIAGGADDEAEIVAGYRRWTADAIVRGEGIDHGPLPCAVIEPGDDAAAVETSLIENLARLDPDEVNRWDTFARLVKEGRSPEQIGQTFGLTDLYVRRILALGNLSPRIRDLYRREKIDARTVRHLTLASKGQQKEWLALYDSEEQHAPTGSNLKAWLFGGESIPTSAALFPLDTYAGEVIADLFGENGWFADAATFWQAQNEAIALRVEAYRKAGWAGVEVLEPGCYFHAYEHEKTPKTKGGKVFVQTGRTGEVMFHEGFLSGKEAKKTRADAGRAGRTDADRKASQAGRPETTSALQTYIDLHRHAAVRAVLVDHPGVALRLMIAHAIVGSPLWRVQIEKQTAPDDAIAESIETSPGEARFDAVRRNVIALLGFSPEEPTVAGGNGSDVGAAVIFARLLALDDAAVLSVVAVVMGETLMARSAMVEMLGAYLKVDMAALWAPDDAFFDLIRDRQVTAAILRDVAGKKVADANLGEKTKTQKAIVRDFLAGTNNRKQVRKWVPKWLAFPPATYAGRPLPTFDRFKSVQALLDGLPVPSPAASGIADLDPVGIPKIEATDADASIVRSEPQTETEYAIAAE